MARLGPEPIYRHTDVDETLLKGGYIYTYVSGASTTAKATYADSKLTIKNPNPVVLDSMGEAKIYLATDAEYRFVIKDADGTTLYTVDNVVPVTGSDKLYVNKDVASNSIVSASDGDIEITPDGVGRVILDGLYWPEADGVAGALLTTNGEGKLSFGTSAFELVLDTTPQLGADLDCNSFDIKMNSGTGIRDDSDNEQLIFTKTTSAVNYIEITNAATGNSPSITAAGSDTNPKLVITPKGSGAVQQNGLSLPTEDGVSGAPMVTDGAGILTLAHNTGATQTQMETRSAAAVVTPASAQYSPSAAKAWLVWDGDTDTILDSYNIASMTVSTSYVILYFDTPFSSANYVCIGSTTREVDNFIVFGTQTAGSVYAYNYDNGAGLANWVNAAGTVLNVVFYGDQ